VKSRRRHSPRGTAAAPSPPASAAIPGLSCSALSLQHSFPAARRDCRHQAGPAARMQGTPPPGRVAGVPVHPRAWSGPGRRKLRLPGRHCRLPQGGNAQARARPWGGRACRYSLGLARPSGSKPRSPGSEPSSQSGRVVLGSHSASPARASPSQLPHKARGGPPATPYEHRQA